LRCLLLLVAAATPPLVAGERPPAPVWTVSDADSTVFLVWSIHLLREKDLPIPESFDRVYAEAEEVVFEIDMAAMSRPASAEEMHRLGLLPPGETLADRFGAGTMERLRAYLRELGKPESFLDSYDPGMVFLLLSSFEAARLGARAEFGAETTIYAKCLADGKPNRGLETIAYQVSLFDELDDFVIEEYVNRSIDERDKNSGVFDRIVAAWRSGDVDALAAELEEDSTLPGKLREVLLTRRNRNWIAEIEKALATDRDVMFLVGAAHLVGEESVVDLLREKGLEVKQLASAE